MPHVVRQLGVRALGGEGSVDFRRDGRPRPRAPLRRNGVAGTDLEAGPPVVEPQRVDGPLPDVIPDVRPGIVLARSTRLAVGEDVREPHRSHQVAHQMTATVDLDLSTILCRYVIDPADGSLKLRENDVAPKDCGVEGGTDGDPSDAKSSGGPSGSLGIPTMPGVTGHAPSGRAPSGPAGLPDVPGVGQ